VTFMSTHGTRMLNWVSFFGQLALAMLSRVHKSDYRRIRSMPMLILTHSGYCTFGSEGGTGYTAQSQIERQFYIGDVPERYILADDDLIVAMTDQSNEACLVVLVVPQSGYYLHNQRLGLVTDIDTHKAYKIYLYYLFNTWLVIEWISKPRQMGPRLRHTSPSRDISDVD
jgi:type I restriction enzyme S subunit